MRADERIERHPDELAGILVFLYRLCRQARLHGEVLYLTGGRRLFLREGYQLLLDLRDRCDHGRESGYAGQYSLIHTTKAVKALGYAVRQVYAQFASELIDGIAKPCCGV